MVVHTGGYHCGAVRFEVEAPAEAEVDECDCSIARLTVRPFEGQNQESAIGALRS